MTICCNSCRSRSSRRASSSRSTGRSAGAPFSGKPDCRFVLDLGQGRIHCIYDWKVHGYCSKYGASPSKGYMTCLDGFKAAKPSRSQGKEHAMFLAMDFRGLTINSGYMEFCNDEYADQLCLYGWLLGEKVGDENVVCRHRGTVCQAGRAADTPLRPAPWPGQGGLPSGHSKRGSRPAGTPSPAATSSPISAAKTAMPAAKCWTRWR